MAITSAGVSRDAVISDDGNLKALFEQALPGVGASSTYNQGDICCLDSSGHYIRAVTAASDGATVLGIAPNSVTAGVLNGAYPSGVGTVGSQQPQALQGPLYGCVAGIKVHTGDSLTFGCKVFLQTTSDTQTVGVTDSAAAGDYVGIYCGPAVTAVAGVYYPIKVGFRLATTEALHF